MANGGETVDDLTPRWDKGGAFEMAAVPQSGLVQYGSLLIPGTDTRAALGYRRYRDCDKNDSPGQDFAVVRGDRQYLVGVLADGVGQSFFGNLAAERVSTWLLRELWNKRASPPGDEEMQAGLKTAEQDLASVVEGYSLEHLPEWHRNALEVTRRAGSQAVFAAFTWEFGRRRGCLYQVGDAVSVVFGQAGAEKIEAHAKGRWSSAGRSQLHLRCTPLVDTLALLLKSDGADAEWGLDINRQITDAPEFAAMANRRAEGDDVSFVAGCLMKETRLARKAYLSPTTVPPPPTPPIGSEEALAGVRAASKIPPVETIQKVPPSGQRSALPVRPQPRSTPFRWIAGAFLAGAVSGFVLALFLLSIVSPEFVQLVFSKRFPDKQNLSPSGGRRATVKDSGRPTTARRATVDGTGSEERQAGVRAIPVEAATMPAIISACKALPMEVKRFLRDPHASVAQVTSSEPLIGLSIDGPAGDFNIRSDLDPRANTWYVLFFQLNPGGGSVQLHAYFKNRAAQEGLVNVRRDAGCFSYEIRPGSGDREVTSPEEAVK